MRLEVKGRNLEIDRSVRAYAEKKLSKLDRQLGEDVRVELELIEERNPSIRENQVAEVAVFVKGPVIRCKQATTDMKASIDKLTDKLLREVKAHRDKQARRHLRHREPKHVPAPPGE